MRFFAIFLLIPAALIAACGGNDNDDAPQPASTVQAQRSETAVAGVGSVKVLAIGQQATLNYGLKVTVQNVERNPVIMEGTRERTADPGVRFALVTLRLDNTGSDDAGADISVECDGGASGARYFYNASGALDLQKQTPAKSYSEGKVLMGVPDNCTNGRIVMKANGVFTEKDPQKSAAWSLP